MGFNFTHSYSIYVYEIIRKDLIELNIYIFFLNRHLYTDTIKPYLTYIQFKSSLNAKYIAPFSLQLFNIICIYN